MNARNDSRSANDFFMNLHDIARALEGEHAGRTLSITFRRGAWCVKLGARKAGLWALPSKEYTGINLMRLIDKAFGADKEDKDE